MALEIRNSHPVITCDHCGHFIVDGTYGNALWLEPKDGKPTREFFFTHKECSRKFEQTAFSEQQRNELLSAEIGVFIYRLFVNCHVNLGDAKHKAELLKMVG